jgi:hypothetical protein
VEKWIKSSLSYKRRQVYFEVEFDGANVDQRTVGDLYITKARDGVQWLAKTELDGQVLRFKEKIQKKGLLSNSRNRSEWLSNCWLRANLGAGTISGIGRIRDVDTRLTMNQSLIALFEVDGRSRDLPASHAYCLEHFAVNPSLRAVLLLKILRCDQDFARIAIVAVLYLRRAAGPAVADAVAFGTRPLDAADAIPREVARALRSLPPVPPGPRRPHSSLWASPWTPGQRPCILLPAADLFGGQAPAAAPPPPPSAPPPPSGSAPTQPSAAPPPPLPPGGPAGRRAAGRRKGGAASPMDLVVDLWPIFRNVDVYALLNADL